MRPFIGVTCSSEPDGRPVVRPPYVSAVLAAGGLPVPLPFVSDEAEAAALLDRLDGLLLTGSEDLDPSLWGESPHARLELMHPARQTTELAFCRAALARDLALLGICGGMQTLAVTAGGRLTQHVPDLGAHVLDHSAGFDGSPHPVANAPGSRLHALLGPNASVNSVHHQAVAELGVGMVAVAHSPDGLIEAYEMPERAFTLCVQWHPERMPHDARQAELLRAFVAAASRPAVSA